MQRSVYGIMSFHPTHEITVPDPQLTSTQGVPNACNQCHLDHSVNWSIEQVKHLWPSRYASAQLSTDEQFDLPEGPRMLFAGDALTRALAADLLSGNGYFKPDPKWARAFLVEALADNYPIVRFFAANGLSATGVPSNAVKPDYLAAPSTRDFLLKQWREIVFSENGQFSQQARVVAAKLATRRRDVDLEVGE